MLNNCDNKNTIRNDLHTTMSYTILKSIILIEQCRCNMKDCLIRMNCVLSPGPDFRVSVRGNARLHAFYTCLFSYGQVWLLCDIHTNILTKRKLICTLTSPQAYVCGGHNHDRWCSQYAGTQSHKMFIMKIIIKYSRDETLHMIRQN